MRADIAACAPFDPLADAQEALAELDLRYTALRGLKPATAALLFASEAAWRNALGRIGVEIGQRRTDLIELLRAAGLALEFSLAEIARPIAHGAGIRWTGD